MGLGAGLGRLADGAWCRAGWSRRRPSGQFAACADDHRPRRTRGMVSGTRRAPCPHVEVGARTCARGRTLGSPDALRARLHDATPQLPDLAVWLEPSGPPWAVVAESGGRREDRQKLMLEGWRDAVHSGRYAGVRYDCASASVATWISRLAKRVWLTVPDFSVIVQTTAEEIATLARADAEGEGRVGDEPETTVGAARTRNGKVSIAPVGGSFGDRPAARSAPLPATLDRDLEPEPAPSPPTRPGCGGCIREPVGICCWSSGVESTGR